MAIRLFFVALFVVPLAAQRSSSFDDLAQPVAAKIAAALVPGDQVTLTLAPADEGDGAALLPVEAEIRRALAARGIRTLESGAAASLRVGCSSNLRERACVAELRRGESRDVISVTRPLDTSSARQTLLSLELIPIFSQPAPILDVALAGNRLMVLDPERITWYEQQAAERGHQAEVAGVDRAIAAGRWISRRSAVISHARPWPRDVRGRLRADEATVTAWLPGVTCRAAGDLLRLVCGDERGEPWPIGIDNTGIDAARNYFNTPEGLPFFAAAPLAVDAGARWITASTNGELLFLDDARRTAAAGMPADDVAALDGSCRAGARHLLVASAAGADSQRDALRAYRVTRRRLIALTAPASVAGRITALWSAPGASVATTIAHDEIAGRYEAFQVRIGCEES
jgi:hypothetical protein